ncbi:MAG: hypothetical protein HY858_00685 [Candidatus Solibacter usitatus]|nr:hypothetical protein [Candidatus Solibacter usitatus]
MILRFYSCLFVLIAGVFMTGVSLVLLLSGSKNFKFDMLPFWKGDTALYWLLGLGLAGVLTAVAGLLGKLRPLLVVYTVGLLGLMVYGFFMSPAYRFSGQSEAKSVAWIGLAGLVAVAGSLMQFKERRRA